MYDFSYNPTFITSVQDCLISGEDSVISANGLSGRNADMVYTYYTKHIQFVKILLVNFS